MYVVVAVRLTTVLAVVTLLNAEEVDLDNNAFSRIAKVNLKYDEYKNDGHIYQIDMKIPSDYYTKRRSARAATSEKNRLWPDAIVPYIIADSIMKRDDHYKLLLGAMKEWEKKTCIKFKKRKLQRNFVEFYYGSGCNSDVGVMGTGRQTTSLGEGCGDHGIMVHEIGHLLGLYHEQNRPDRNKYVKILKDNIIPTYHYAFDIKEKEEINSRDVPYDYYSVMHYGSTDFSKNKKPTIVALKKGITQFGNDKISNLDAKVVNLMYRCPELIKFPNDFHWKHYGLSRRDKDCIRVNEPEDPYSWNNNYLCRRAGKTVIGLQWSHKGPIEDKSCIKAEAPSMDGKFGWDNNYFCWPKDSVYKFTWMTKKPHRSIRHQCVRIYEPRDRMWKKINYYLCGKKDESPVNGQWGPWSEWSRCTRQCGGGFHRRMRACNNPAPSYGGMYCQGNSFMTGSCGTNSCDDWPKFPDDFVYKQFELPPTDKICLRTFERYDFYRWTNHLFCTPDDKKDPYFTWSDVGPVPKQKCVRIFNPIESKRVRNSWDDNYLCTPKDSPYKFLFSRKGPVKGHRCLPWQPQKSSGWDNSYLCNKAVDGPQAQLGGENPSAEGSWSSWEEWGKCSKSCAGGIQRRFRSCSQRNPNTGKPGCPGSTYESRRCNVHGCIIDGKWSDWEPWTKCTKSCGGGEQHRRRACSNPAPQNGGKTCEGVDVVRRKCNANLCAIHGGWSPWSWWGRCSRTCGQGIQLRSRTCTNPTPRDGGRMCFGLNGETRMCNSGPCPIDGAWGRWSSWNECSKPCSGGIQKRRRSCSNPPAKYGGRKCLGAKTEEQRCNTYACPIDGAWTQWSDWRACSKSCGGGVQTRMRTCSNPMPRYGGKRCYGKDVEEQGCKTQPCPLPPVHGEWSSWTSWQTCTKTCAGGVQKRMRTCTDPSAQHGGRACGGRSFQERRCNTAACPRKPIHGRWSPWSWWRPCTKSCGGGKQFRRRGCTNPKPAYGGRRCIGRTLESRQCNTKSCGVDGRWSLWAKWDACSKSCGGGTQWRRRTCSNPRPSNGGRTCTGRSSQIQKCNTNRCQARVDGRWNRWSSWKPCSATCGGGTQQRMRSCTNPKPAFGGRKCQGGSLESRRCSSKPCRVEAKWSTWSSWKTCSRSCGGGTQQRTRKCSKRASCVGRSYETRRCNRRPCRIDGRWSLWSSWRSCTKQCGGGFQRRERTCTNPKPSNGGRNCGGASFETQRCNTNPCRVDGRWSPWSSWRSCTKQCGGGLQRRERTCTNPRPSNGGRNCGGASFETQRCNTNPCRVDGRWTSWSSWKACSRLCSGGRQQRTRSCTNPRPSHGGQNCYGPTNQVRVCNNRPCRVDGKWTKWSSWQSCNKQCGDGLQQRIRTCTNPKPANGGRNCNGPPTHRRRCNTHPCKVDGRWSNWTPWGACSSSCNGGSQRRHRTCSNPAPLYGGRLCGGRRIEERECNRQPCSQLGLKWGKWSDCSSSCGGGTQTRKCLERCSGKKLETRACNTFRCKMNCGGEVSGYGGKITSPRYPGHYPNDIECTWIINVPEGLKVKLRISFFYMENGDACQNDFLEIRDGPSYNSPKLGRFCGAAKPETQMSTNSRMWVRFRANSYHSYTGFSASWSPTKDSLVTEAAAKVNGVYNANADCSGYIKSNYGHLTSPGYPTSYLPNLNCEWIITVSKGRIIQFYFDVLDVDDRGYCRYDYVGLRDGDSRSSPSLGRFCGNKKPDRERSKTTSNVLKVRFKTDDSTQSKGFSLWWTSYYRYKSSKPRREIKDKCPHKWIPHRENNQLYCYSLRTHYHTWDQAHVKCAHWGAHLASVQSEKEQDFLRYHLLKDNYAWFGLSDYKQAGNWTWADGAPLTYTNWARGEPNRGETFLNEHCALMKPNGRWNDYPCDFKFMFVCKKRQET